MAILQEIMNQWQDPYRRTVALHGINVEGGFPGAGTPGGVNYGGPGHYFQVYQGGNPNGGNSVSRYFPSSQAGISYAAANPDGAFHAGGFSGFDTNAFAQRFERQPMLATDWQVAQIERPRGYNSGNMVYSQTPNVWNNVTYPNLNTLGIDPATMRPNPAGGGAQQLAYQAPPAAPAPAAPAAPAAPTGVFFDKGTNRYYRYEDFADGKPRLNTDVPSWEQTANGWVAHNAGAASGGQSQPRTDTRGKAGLSPVAQRPSPPAAQPPMQAAPMSYTPQAQDPRMNRAAHQGTSTYPGTSMAQPQYGYNRAGNTVAQPSPIRTAPQAQAPRMNRAAYAGTSTYPNPMQPNMGTFNANPMGQMYVANGNGVGMYRAPMNMNYQMPMQSPMMSRAPMAMPPVTSMGGGMFGYQGGQYSANGLRLSQMQSGFR